MSWSGRGLVATAVIALVPLSVDAEDTEYPGGPPPGAEPLEVRIGFNLVNLTDINESEETIDFDGSFTLSSIDPRLAYDPASVGLPDWKAGDYSRTPRKVYTGGFQVKEIYPGWRPHLAIANGIGNRSTNDMILGIWPDGTIIYAETFAAKVEAPMQMRRFPFDRQQLEVFVHPFFYRRSEVLLDARIACAGIGERAANRKRPLASRLSRACLIASHTSNDDSVGLLPFPTEYYV